MLFVNETPHNGDYAHTLTQNARLAAVDARIDREARRPCPVPRPKPAKHPRHITLREKLRQD